MRAVWPAVPLLVLAAACGAHRTEPVAQLPPEATWLERLVDGTTTRDRAIGVLGPPSGRFEDDRILTWRLDKHLETVPAELVPGRERTSWTEERYCLVATFDESAVLVRHRLLRVR